MVFFSARKKSNFCFLVKLLQITFLNSYWFVIHRNDLVSFNFIVIASYDVCTTFFCCPHQYLNSIYADRVITVDKINVISCSVI